MAGVTGVGGHNFYEGMAAGQEPMSGDIAYDANGMVIRTKVTTVVSDATAGYGKGCLLIDTDSTTPGSIVFLNEGTSASSDFNGVVTSASLTTTLGSYFPLAGGTLADGANIALNTTTGTKIGTAATQKLGLWNATPIVQPSSTGETTGFTAGSGTAAKNDSTFTGNSGTKAYTVGDIVKHLKAAGILASS